ncbi:MAG: bifunctional acetate--CoA ligase family protein/GNAT family N-acetyltransferase [Proteobacteria bacterium]|nr:bifunctional acetate--CoA ligase family protein/GNAT family N-acetyltransferase [Pseudomonadota bacterium]
MSIRNLDKLLDPKSIALIGATPKPGSVGAVLARNLLHGGFAGPVLPVNPKYDAIEGVFAYRDVASLPTVPDLAVICTPPETVPGLIGELGARGCRAAIVITAGFGELGEGRGKALERAMLEAARPYLMRIVGPNCLGVMAPGIGLNATFAHVVPPKGDIAFVTQSGAMATVIVDWAKPRKIGFSQLVSLGDMSDVDFGDMLDWLANDGQTRAILLYIEAVTHARKFMSAARAAARLKPVIVIKAGRHAEAAKAAASHTGALAGADAVYDAAFRRAGMLRVFDIDELFDAVATLAAPPAHGGDRLAILTNGGGLGVLAVDALMDEAGHLASLDAATMARLDAVLPKTWSKGNPVDIIGDADGPRYAAALQALLATPEIDAILALNCPTAIASSVEAADAVVAVAKNARVPVLASWLGGTETALAARARFADARIPSFETPEKAVRGFMHLVRYRRAQDNLMEVPDAAPENLAPDAGAARTVVAAALDAGLEWLPDPDVRAVLAGYGFTLPKGELATDAAGAAAAAARIGGRVALKIVSPQVLHKSDVGGVALDLDGPQAVALAAAAMVARVHAKVPGAEIRGFLVQEMVRRPDAHELILGTSEDRQFGPAILFGQGGTAVEVMADTAMALPPLNVKLARELIAATRVSRLLKGYRDRPAANMAAVELALVRLSQLVCDLDAVAELDINPLVVDAKEAIVLDARIRVRRPESGVHAARLAIEPYPSDLVETVLVDGAGPALLRPIRPEDGPLIETLIDRMDADDRRMRFFAPVKRLSRSQLARLTQIDYDREMAFVCESALLGMGLLGVVRIVADPDRARAEYAIALRSDLKGIGLGRRLMVRILDYAKARGVGEVFGDVLRENHKMLDLCRALGFAIRSSAESPELVHAVLGLAAWRGAPDRAENGD